jgi:hypothetical protein
MLQQLAIARPAAPVPYLKNLLTQPAASHTKAIIAGPPGAGAATLVVCCRHSSSSYIINVSSFILWLLVSRQLH